jgi:hypothetical protein
VRTSKTFPVLRCPLCLREPPLGLPRALHLIDPGQCAQRALDLLTPAAPGHLRTPAPLLGTAAVPTLAPSLLPPGAAATHRHGLGPQSVAVVTYQTVDHGPPQDVPDPDPFPDPSPAHRPSAVEHVPAPTTREAQVAVPIDLVARLLGLSHRRVEAKALLAGETAAIPDQFPGLSHLHLVVGQRPEVEDIQLNLFHPLLADDVRLQTLSLAPAPARLLPGVAQNHGDEAIRGHPLGVDKSGAADALISTWGSAAHSVCYK